GGAAASDPAAPLRARAVRSALRVRLAERHRAPRGRARADADRPLPVVGSARGGPAQATLRPAGPSPGRVPPGSAPGRGHAADAVLPVDLGVRPSGRRTV